MSGNKDIIGYVDLIGFREIANAIMMKCGHLGIRQKNAMQALRRRAELLLRRSYPQAQFELYPWGTDSWVLRFISLEEAIATGRTFLRRCLLDLAEGISLIKPVFVLSSGSLEFSNGQPIDTDSISLYEVTKSEGIRPFDFLIAEDLLQYVNPESGIVWSGKKKIKSKCKISFRRCRWSVRGMQREMPQLPAMSLRLGTLTLDAIFSSVRPKSLQVLKTIQNDALQSIKIVGGPPPVTSSEFEDYVRFQHELIKRKSSIEEFEFIRLGLLYRGEHSRNYFWLMFNAHLLEKYPVAYKFRITEVPKGSPRPISFHLIDDRFVHIGLRSYSTEESTLLMSGGLCLESQELADAFEVVFSEYWRNSKDEKPKELRRRAKSFEKKIDSPLRKHIISIVRKYTDAKA